MCEPCDSVTYTRCRYLAKQDPATIHRCCHYFYLGLCCLEDGRLCPWAPLKTYAVIGHRAEHHDISFITYAQSEEEAIQKICKTIVGYDPRMFYWRAQEVHEVKECNDDVLK